MSLVPTREDERFAALSAKLAEAENNATKREAAAIMAEAAAIEAREAAEAKLAEAERELERTKLHMSAWEDSARINKHRAEASEGKLRMIVSHATMGATTGEGMSVNDISVKISEGRNALYNDGKKRGAEAAEARVAELEKALKPFADAASAFSFAIGPDGIDDDMTVVAYPHVQPNREVVLSTRNFSDARAALSATKEPKPDTPTGQEDGT